MKNVFAIALCAVALTGCQEILSNVLVGPDEMSVVDAAPLTLPPSFELRPPRPGQSAATLESEDARLKAEALIVGEAIVTAEDVENQTSTTATEAEEDAWLFNKIDEAGTDEAIEVESVVAPRDIPEKGFFQRTFSKANSK